ncbi:MAG: hypothetical protein KTR17_02950 [Cellvibrionaceae bacterium]|nr:hypothetical protein [Cellvibrionaceae bacterium]
MSLDQKKLLSFAPIKTRQNLTRQDVMLYALGVGAEELDFVYENKLKVLPTMAAILASPGFYWQNPAYAVNWKKILHGEQSVEIHSALPIEAELLGVTTLGPLIDKGVDKGAICYHTHKIYNNKKHCIATSRATWFLRGDGTGEGGSEGGGVSAQQQPHEVPLRPPELSHTQSTSSNQAMIYRLSGDYNPLHIDPSVAKEGGFERPILHGLCTYGVACRSLIATLCDNNPDRLKRIDVRFSNPVYPGETIRTDVWKDAPGKASFQAIAVERNIPVLKNGYVELAP